MLSEWATLAIAVVIIIVIIVIYHDAPPPASGAMTYQSPAVRLRRQIGSHGERKEGEIKNHHHNVEEDNGALGGNSAIGNGRNRREGPAYGNRHPVRKRITVHGNTSEFCLKDIQLVNVVSVELVRAVLPRAQYVIDEHNCHLDYKIGEACIQTVTFPTANNHTARTLAQYLNDNTPLRVQYNLETAKYYFVTCDGSAFSLLFGSGPNRKTSACRELGFEMRDYEASLLGGEGESDILSVSSIRSPNRADISGARYIHVLTDELDGQHQRGLLAEVPVLPPSPFAVFDPGTIERRTFENPISLHSLTLRLSDYDVVKNMILPYKFHGMFWSLTLEVTTMDVDLPAEILSIAENDWHSIDPVYRATKDEVVPSRITR